jgi:hypothetical protein
MEQSKMTQVFGVSPDELRESILIDVRAEFKFLALQFQLSILLDKKQLRF